MNRGEHDAAVRVVLADDEPLMRAGLRTMLEVGGTVRVVGEADDGDALLEQVDRHRPRLAPPTRGRAGPRPADRGTGSAVR